MRVKIVIVVLLAGVAGFIGIFFLKHLAAPAQPPENMAAQPEIKPAAPTITPIPNAALAAKPVLPVPQVKTSRPAGADTNTLAEEHEAYVQARVDKLKELQANDDAESLHAILAELTNANKEIRAAAVESSIQFGSRDAIPVLNDLAARTSDPAEKKELQDAAEFLALPTLIEAEEQARQAKLLNGGLPK